MIILQATSHNPWLRAARYWPFALLLVNLAFWPALSYLKLAPRLQYPLWLAMPQGALLLWVMGRWATPPRRLLAFAVILGAFAFLPLLIGLFIPLFALLVLTHPTNETMAVGAAVALLLVYWVTASVRQLRARLAATRFFERELQVLDDRLVLNRRPKTDLDAMYVGSSPVSWLGALLVFATPLAYLGAQLADDHTSPRGTLLQVAVLATPLAIHVLGHMARGAYLWIYRVRQLERTHGKPMVAE